MVEGREGGGFAPFNGGRLGRFQSQVNHKSRAGVLAGAGLRLPARLCRGLGGRVRSVAGSVCKPLL